jgi:iron complex transport system substrate-binding protein
VSDQVRQPTKQVSVNGNAAVRSWRLVAVALAMALASGLGSAVEPSVTVTDDDGQSVAVHRPPLRIASLSPGATEMLFAAGAGDQVIATVEYSDEPPPARQIPRIGDANGVDMERLVGMRPDVAVVWPGGGNPAQIEKLIRLGIPVYRQQVNRLSEMAGSLRRLGALAGTTAVAEAAARELEGRIEHLQQQYGSGRSPTVLLEVWNRPVYTVGGPHLMSDQVRLCGARNVFSDLSQLSAVVTSEAVIARSPDIIIALAPPGQGASWLTEWKVFGSLTAVRRGGLIAFEDQRFSRLAPSAITATEELCRKIAAVSRGSY